MTMRTVMDKRESAEIESAVVEHAPLNGERHTRSTPDGKGERVDFPITGMSCVSSASRIEKDLASAPVVRRATGCVGSAARTLANHPPRLLQ